MPSEFEQVRSKDSIDRLFDRIDNKERCGSVGITNGDRLFSVA